MIIYQSGGSCYLEETQGKDDTKTQGQICPANLMLAQRLQALGARMDYGAVIKKFN